MNEQLNFNVTQASTWRRIGFMLVYAVIDSLVRTLIWAVILLQIVTALVTGRPNPNILNFGRSLSTYIYRITLFMTFNTETLPFPFSAWDLTVEPQSPELKNPAEEQSP